MFSLIWFILYTDNNGNEYDTNAKKTLIKVKQSTTEIIIDPNVEVIQGGSSSSSAFSLCAQTIQVVSFDKNSKLRELGRYLFNQTSLQKIDFSQCAQLKTISSACFQYCSKLAEVTLPPNVETIASGAFAYAGITTMAFPNSLTRIEDFTSTYGCTFGYCPQLTSFTIGEESQLQYIGTNAFYQSKLTEFHIPKKLSFIGNGVFCLNPIEFTSDPENPYFSTDKKTIYNKNGTIIIAVSSKDFGEPYTVRENVTLIQKQSFRNVPGSVEFANENVEFDMGAFYNTYIKTIKIPTGQTEIAENCFESSLLETVDLHPGIVVIKRMAFARCESLKEIKIYNGTRKIESSVFMNCISLDITIPSSVQTIEISCFSGVNPDNIHFVNTTKFKIIKDILYCDSNIVDYLGSDENQEIEISDNVNILPQQMFANRVFKSMVFLEPSKCYLFDSEAFSGSSIQSITFPSSMRIIRSSCFKDCKSLTTVKFNGTFNEIPVSCFSGCEKLQQIEIHTNNSIDTIKSEAFYMCKSLELDFSLFSSLVAIETKAFFGTKSTIVNLPQALSNISDSCFESSQVETVYFSTAIENDASNRRILETNSLSFVPVRCFYSCTKLQHFYFGESTTIIQDNAFANCQSLLDFKLGKGITTISLYAFYNCTSLCSVTIPDGSQLSQIQGYAFLNTNLSSFVIEGQDYIFKDGLLMNSGETTIIYYIKSPNVKSFILPKTIEEITAYAFQASEDLIEVFIGDGNLKRIGYRAFKDCYNLRRIVLPDSLESIGESSFENCNKIVCGGITLPEKPQLIQEAEAAGIPEKAISAACRNNIDALYKLKIQCSCNRYIIKPLFAAISLIMSY